MPKKGHNARSICSSVCPRFGMLVASLLRGPHQNANTQPGAVVVFGFWVNPYGRLNFSAIESTVAKTGSTE
jgi:hypothetical protein